MFCGWRLHLIIYMTLTYHHCKYKTLDINDLLFRTIFGTQMFLTYPLKIQMHYIAVGWVCPLLHTVIMINLNQLRWYALLLTYTNMGLICTSPHVLLLYQPSDDVWKCWCNCTWGGCYYISDIFRRYCLSCKIASIIISIFNGCHRS